MLCGKYLHAAACHLHDSTAKHKSTISFYSGLYFEVSITVSYVCSCHMKLTGKSSVTQMYIALVNKLQPRFAETLIYSIRAGGFAHNYNG